MKKVLLSTVSLLLIASLMGCNAKPGNEETSQTTADTVETTVAPDIPVVPDEKEEITFTSGLNIICVFCLYKILSVHNPPEPIYHILLLCLSNNHSSLWRDN